MTAREELAAVLAEHGAEVTSYDAADLWGALRTWATRAGGVASRARRSEFTRGVIAATEHARDVADEIAAPGGPR